MHDYPPQPALFFQRVPRILTAPHSSGLHEATSFWLGLQGAPLLGGVSSRFQNLTPGEIRDDREVRGKDRKFAHARMMHNRRNLER